MSDHSTSDRSPDAYSNTQGTGPWRHENRALIILNTISQALNASVDLASMLERTLAEVAEHLNLHTGWVLLFDDADTPYLGAAQNLPSGLIDEPERMAGWCYCLDSFRKGDLGGAANVNVVTCSRLKKLFEDRTVAGTGGLRYHASIPLKVYRDGKPKRLGMLNVAAPQWHQLSRDELRLLHTVGDVVAVAVERARLHEQHLKSAQVEERNRLAREIHDTLAQGLAAITLQLEAAEASLDQGADPNVVRRYTGNALDLARRNLEEARRSVLDLRAAPLESHTLPEALKVLVHTLAATHKPMISVHIPDDVPVLSPRIEVGLYRIAQEALANAVSHADAEAIKLTLTTSSRSIHLTIEDDGTGFDTDRLHYRGGPRFGLIGMHERARLLGGMLYLESEKDIGTRIKVVVPLEQ